MLTEPYRAVIVNRSDRDRAMRRGNAAWTGVQHGSGPQVTTTFWPEFRLV